MLKKVILAGLLVVSGANAGMFDSVVSAVGGGSTAKAVDGNALDSTIQNYVTAKALLQKSSEALSKAILSKEESGKFESALKAAESISDPKEKDIKVEQETCAISSDKSKIYVHYVNKENNIKLNIFSFYPLQTFLNYGIIILILQQRRCITEQKLCYITSFFV